MTNTKLFTNSRYLTSTVSATVHPSLMAFMWQLIDSLPEERDYLQVFDLYEANGEQKIVHRSEEPEHREEYVFPYLSSENIINDKIYVIDDGDHSTMLFADEY